MRASSCPSTTPASCEALFAATIDSGRDEHSGRRVLRRRHVEHADRHGGAVDLAFAARREVREKRRHGDAARAGAPDVDVRAAGDVAHHVDGFLQRLDVGVEPEVAFGGRRVLPADGEGLQAALEAIAG